ncbi:CD48 antigen-like [Alosa pseudoharengus]|uniref:CD48 antigen-like n=1 Tax=Alosa pseudoharengus TaxID=34774 RepID=UPI003F8AAA70
MSIDQECSRMVIMSPLMVFGVMLLSATAMSGGEMTIHVLEGRSVDLKVNNSEKEEHAFTWYVNKTKRIVTYHPMFRYVDVSGQYKGRVEFSNETFDLRLNSVQRNDSGLYNARTMRDENSLVQYTLSVLEHAAAPTLTVEPNRSSNDTCDVMVTCTGHDLNVTSTCNSTSCSPVGGTYTDPALLLSVKDDNIICNHSNPVSWRVAKVKINQLCGTVAPPADATLYLLIPVSLKALLLSIALITRALQSALTTSESERD